jgi:hypothetical protein
MMGDRDPFAIRTAHFPYRTACAAACALVVWAGAAAAQDAPQRPRPEPGLFGIFGKWVDDTLSDVNSGLGDARGTLNDAAGRATDTAKDAADTAAKVARIPLTGVVSGRQRCLAAPNQAPDCQAATDALCRDKGFKSGRSVDVQSAQKCPAEVWISGRQATAAECTMETYVTRAMCQ